MRVVDVKVDGGLTAQNVSPPLPCGSAEACNGQFTAPASHPTAGTATFNGPSNEVEKKVCKKGKAHGKRGHSGRCGKHKKKPHKHKKHKAGKHNKASKNSNRGGAK